MDEEKIEAEIERMLEESKEDFSELEEFISEQEDSYSGNLADFAFRAAIRSGNTAYVDEHIYDFELNDGDGYSTYLDETDDEEMQELLMNFGAAESWDDYDCYPFALENLGYTILSFTSDFQKEVFRKYKETRGLSDERIAQLLSEETGDASNRELRRELTALGVSVGDAGLTLQDKYGDHGLDLMMLLEKLGWKCDFRGQSWKLESTGVYFIE